MPDQSRERNVRPPGPVYLVVLPDPSVRLGGVGALTL